MIVDEKLNQDLACRGNTLAVMAQNGKEIFVLSHCLMRLHETPFKCNKNYLHHDALFGKLSCGSCRPDPNFYHGSMKCKEMFIVV
jgi:hypothetical protein